MSAPAGPAVVEDLRQRCVKYGDTVYFKIDGKAAFLSAHDKMTPQVGVGPGARKSCLGGGPREPG